jgi:3-dehydroquinate dehydratase
MKEMTPTYTLARLYEKQGLLVQAAEVYRRLIVADPDRAALRDALREVEKRLEKKSGNEKSDGRAVLRRLEQWQKALFKRKELLRRQDGNGIRIMAIRGPDAVGSESAEMGSVDATVAEKIEKAMRDAAQIHGIELEVFQADGETAWTEKIGEVPGNYNALIMVRGSSNLGIALDDALSALDVPVIEVLLFNLCEGPCEEPKNSRMATAHLAGFGLTGLALAVDAVAEMVAQEQKLNSKANFDTIGGCILNV